MANWLTLKHVIKIYIHIFFFRVMHVCVNGFCVRSFVYVYVWATWLCTCVFGECSKLFIFFSRIFRYFISNASFHSFSPSLTLCTPIWENNGKNVCHTIKMNTYTSSWTALKNKTEKKSMCLNKTHHRNCQETVQFCSVFIVVFDIILIFSVWTVNVFVAQGQT